MILSAVSVLVVAQLSSEIPEGLMNNPVLRNVVDKSRRQGVCGFLGGFFEDSLPVAGEAAVSLVQCSFIDVSKESCVLMFRV